MADLKASLSKIWGIKELWRLISLGRSYYHLLLNSQDNKNNVWKGGIVGLKPETFRVQPWQPNFSPMEQKIARALVWVKLHYLPWEY